MYMCVYVRLNRRSTHKVKRVSKGYGVTCPRMEEKKKRERYEREAVQVCAAAAGDR